METLTALDRALERRAELLERLGAEGTTIYRAFSGEKEGIPGLVIDVFDRFATLSLLTGKCTLDENALQKVGTWTLENLGVESAVTKHWGRDRSADGTSESTQVFGKKLEGALSAKENRLFYRVKVDDGLQVGLFADQRENRRQLAQWAAGKQVLNCFSYTCAFSVACGAQGAAVTSVDISKKALEWGKENFELNKLPLDKHRFLAEDTDRALDRLKKQGSMFDLIILDPPSFSRTGEGKVFQVERHLPELVNKAKSIIAPGGALFVSTNYAKWRPSHFQQVLDSVMGKKWNLVPLPEAPSDFAWDSDPLKALFYESH